MAVLDGDRFEGRFRDGVHKADCSDLMRRLVKEQMLRFDGTRLFPERIAYTVQYKLSDPEADLYKQVTDYVRDEFNRAEALENEGRKGTVGFALTILQRRLASSPEAIFQSLRRRKERLEKRVREERLLKRGADLNVDPNAGLPVYTIDDLEDLEDAPDAEIEETEERVVDQASAARTIAESPLPPVVLSGAMVVPLGLLRRLQGLTADAPPTFAADTERSEKLAMDAVMRAERGLGFDPKDVSEKRLGYDLESRILGTGRLRFIEVKGRAVGAKTVTVTKNEILTALNKPDDFILAIVPVDGDTAHGPRYVRRPFQREPDFAATSVNYDLDDLLRRAEDPA